MHALNPLTPINSPRPGRSTPLLGLCSQLALLLLLAAARPAAAAEEARFFNTADIHKDKIVFSFEGDLWSASASGGTATRLTSFPGDELYPHFSPDGRSIAFLGNYDGAPAIYRIPAEGGQPQRLTYTSGVTRAIEWTPDGKRVIFSTLKDKVIERDPVLYSASLGGDTAPERLPIDRGSFCSFAPDGRRMVYNRHTYMPGNWKRYKGGQHSDIWIYDYETKKFSPMSDHDGLCADPMWIGGKIYYICDCFGDMANLCAWSVETHAFTQVTRYTDYGVQEPATDGQRIVFMQNGYLNVYDPATDKTQRLTINVPSDHWRMRDRIIDPRAYIHGTSVANSGRTAVVEARGDLYSLPVGKGQVRNLSKDCGSCERLPRISPDGKQVAFFSDRSGEYQLYIQPLDGGKWTTITASLTCYPGGLEWSPDGKKLLFGSRKTRIYVCDLPKRKLIKIDDIQTSNGSSKYSVGDYAWAPDSNWIAYTSQAANENSRIVLYSLEQNKRYFATSEFYDNDNPRFDQNGDYLYFISKRNFDVRLDPYSDNHIITNPSRIMATQLHAGQQPPFEDKDDEAAAAAPVRPSTPPGGNPGRGPRRGGKMVGLRPTATPAAAIQATSSTKAPTTSTTPLKIDIRGIATRTFPLPVPAGSYSGLDAGRGRVLWFSMISTPGVPGPRLHIFDMKDHTDAVIEDAIRGYDLSVNGEQLLLHVGADYAVTSLDKLRLARKVGDRLKLDGMIYRLDTVKEWTQIFNDTWRWYREYFYDAGMHGHDWKAIGDHYRAMIPGLTTRGRLNWVMLEMVGELCCSHSYIAGGDLNELKPADPPVYTGLLGADIKWDGTAGAFRLARIYGPTDFNLDLKGPLVSPAIKVKEGDFLLAIDGQALRANADFNRLLQVTRGQKVSVMLNDKPTTAGAQSYDVMPLTEDRDLRYYRWVSDNIAKVAKATGDRVGYMHFRDMSDNTIAEFDKFWRAFQDKDGIIIDVRGNSGGYTEYFLIDKLERRQVAFTVPRATAPYRYPESAGNRRYVALTNHDNGSCGELFLEHFRACGLGKIIGTHSWGGLVGINSALHTVDEGLVNQPNVAFYGRAGKWWVENHGVDPDIVLDNDPATVMAGRDVQLERAIAEVMSELDKDKQDPARAFPPRPQYPKR